jgi:hypothetical protein
MIYTAATEEAADVLPRDRWQLLLHVVALSPVLREESERRAQEMLRRARRRVRVTTGT